MIKLKLPKQKKNRLIILMLLFIISGYLLITGRTDLQKMIFPNWVNAPDHRPGKKILFIGNSRTYVNNLPDIVKNMADSSSPAPFRYEVAMHALGGHTFEDHNANSAVHQLLDNKWDYVILQGGSPENTNPDSSDSFIKHGQELVKRILSKHSQPILLTAWTYDKSSYDFENETYLKPYFLKYAASYQEYFNRHGFPPKNKPAPETFFPLNIEKHYLFIQNDYHVLSTQNNTLMVNVGEAFKHLLAANPHFASLTSDGNHPNMQGSYLAAAMLHVCFSKTPARSITYVPSGLSSGDAKAIRAFVDQFYPDGTCPALNQK